MDRFDIQQKIYRSIEEQMARKWPQHPSLAYADDSYSLDIKALFQTLEYQFNVKLDIDRDLHRISSVGDLSQFILEKTRPVYERRALRS